ncbi:TRAP transporter small permease subunit, partial [Acinetobacter baumannii]
MAQLARDYKGLDFLNKVLELYGANSNAFLEAQWYMFAVMAMFGAAYTLKLNEHVRVDLIYGWVSERTRTWIDL